MNDITVKDNQVVVGAKTLKVLEKLQEWKIIEQEHKNTESEIKENMMKAMKKAGVKSVNIELPDGSSYNVSYIPPTNKTYVNKKKLAEDGLLEYYQYESPVKESVRVTFKESKNE